MGLDVNDIVKKNPDLAMPEGLSAGAEEAWRLVVRTAVERGLEYTGGSRVFYSPQEWRDRGEQYGTNSELVIVYDGSDVGRLFSLDKDMTADYVNLNAMSETLHSVGFFAEECTCWYAALYKG